MYEKRSEQTRLACAVLLPILNTVVWNKGGRAGLIIVRLGVERSLRDAAVWAIRYRGLKPTANRNRSLRDEVALSIRPEQL